MATFHDHIQCVDVLVPASQVMLHLQMHMSMHGNDFIEDGRDTFSPTCFHAARHRLAIAHASNLAINRANTAPLPC